MKLTIKLFAAARQMAGADQLTIEVAEGARLGELIDAVVAQHPGLAAVIRHAAWAVDLKYAGRNTPLSATSEVALIPPVSGG